MFFAIQKYKNWKFKNTLLLLVSIVVFFFFADTSFVKSFIINIGNLGYFGAFIVGIFFVSTFTVAPASVILFFLAKEMGGFEVAIIAGFGAMLGDYIIFRFLKDKVFEEIKPIFMNLGGSYLSSLLATPYFTWLAPVLGAIIIASPFPDEVGISLMGASKISKWQFLFLTFILNSLGILLIIFLADIL